MSSPCLAQPGIALDLAVEDKLQHGCEYAWGGDRYIHNSGLDQGADGLLKGRRTLRTPLFPNG